MIIICAWCNKWLGLKKGNGISHGICKKCADKLLNEVNKQ
jgi:hypothetical protein